MATCGSTIASWGAAGAGGRQCAVGAGGGEAAGAVGGGGIVAAGTAAGAAVAGAAAAVGPAAALDAPPACFPCQFRPPFGRSAWMLGGSFMLPCGSTSTQQGAHQVRSSGPSFMASTSCPSSGPSFFTSTSFSSSSPFLSSLASTRLKKDDLLPRALPSFTTNQPLTEAFSMLCLGPVKCSKDESFWRSFSHRRQRNSLV
eukprot:15485874-Alexandrium_andersonii.AAC.1